MSNRWHKTSSLTESLDFFQTDINLRSKHKKDDNVSGFNLIKKLKTNKSNLLVIAVLGIVGHKYYGSTIAQAFKSRHHSN